MLTVIIKSNGEPSVVELTYNNIMRELKSIEGAEIIVEHSWQRGLNAVDTPYVMLVEADCTLSANYISSNLGIFTKNVRGLTGRGKGGGGYTKLALMASCLGVKYFDHRIYDFELRQEVTGLFDVRGKTAEVTQWLVRPNRNKLSTSPYHVQVGFIPGAIMRMSSIARDINNLPWDHPNMVEMSTRVCFHLWNTNRRIMMNPNTTYVSTEEYLEDPPTFDPKVPHGAAGIFEHGFALPHNFAEK